MAAADVVAVARYDRPVTLGPAAKAALERGAAVVDRLVGSPEPVYGVSTGFGALANTVIPADRSGELQTALIRSHAAGMGAEVEREVVRAMVLLRARSLAMGFSGARAASSPRRCSGLLNAGLTPIVREHGSLGASGDLAPLAAAALVTLGEGEARRRDGSLVDGATACREAGVEPLTLRAKEGLALINGTDGMLGMVVLALADLDVLLATADVAGAMSTEALLGTDRAFAADLVAMRPQAGQQVSAANLRALLDGSAIVASHRVGDDRVQDAYSLRCTPQVHGAARDTVEPRLRRRRARAAIVHRQPRGPAGRAGRVVRQLPRRTRRRRGRLPRHLDRRRRLDQRAPHRPAARPRPGRTACRRSSAPTPASTRA